MSTIKKCDRCGTTEVCVDYNSALSIHKYQIVIGANQFKEIVDRFDLCNDCFENLKVWIHGKSSS